MRSRYSPVLLSLCAILISVIMVLLSIEIALRFFPVRSYLPYAAVTMDDPVVHYQPHQKFVYSTYWNFQDKNEGVTNAQGYVSDFDYKTQDETPLIAVIGDSYIEARMVPFENTVQEVLRRGLDGRVRVYGFGFSGSPLSQYLAVARMVRDVYKPDTVIFNIVSNDFDESFTAYRNIPRFHYFNKDDTGNWFPELIGTYRNSWIKEWVSYSALVRYIYFHLNISDTVNHLLFEWRDRKISAYTNDKKEYQASPRANDLAADNISADMSPQRISLSQEGIDAFLKLLPDMTGLPPSQIVLMIDGQRYDIYSGTRGNEEFFGVMRSYMLKQASVLSYPVVDMQDVFAKDYARHQKKFEFEQDGHWNAYAHGLAGQALLDQTTLKNRY